MLPPSEIEKITLNAHFVYQHGDGPFFKRALNNLPASLGVKQPFLNYFVRYRISKEDPSLHSWSRVERVVDLSERAAQRRSQLGGEAAASPSTQAPSRDSLVWRDKRFFIALQVVGERGLVLLNRLSNKPPTPDEVRAFCVREAQERPENVYRNNDAGILSAPSLLPTVNTLAADLSDGTPAPAPSSGEGDRTAAAPQPAVAVGSTHPLVGYLPTAEQIAKLHQFRNGVLAKHIWTQEEIEEVRQRNAPYAKASAAAAPVQRTTVDLQNRQLLSSIQQPAGAEQSLSVHGGLAAPQEYNLFSGAGDHSVEVNGTGTGTGTSIPRTLLEDDLLPSQSPTELFFSQTPSQMSAQSSQLPVSMAPPMGSFQNGANPGTMTMSPHSPLPSSPFLPKKRHQRTFPFPGGNTSLSQEPAPHAAPISSLPASQEGERGASTSLSSFSGTQSSQGPRRGQGPRRPSTLLEDSGMMVSMEASTIAGSPSLQHPMPLSQEYHEQLEATTQNINHFYAYIKNPQRQAYIDTAVKLTTRNKMENKRRKLLGLESEKKMDRGGNLLESSGLWVTDDNMRAEKATSYANRSGEGKGASDAPAGGGPGASATAAKKGAPQANDGGETNEADTATKAREEKLKTFLNHRAKQRITLETVDHNLFDRLIRSVTPLSDSAERSPTSAPGEGGASPSNASSVTLAAGGSRGAEDAFRLVVQAAATGREGSRRADADAGSSAARVYPEQIRRQLIHRSAVVHASLSDERHSNTRSRRSTSPSVRAERPPESRKRNRS